MTASKFPAAASRPQMKAFHEDAVREFIEEFPHFREKVERLIREKKIVVLDENDNEIKDYFVKKKCENGSHTSSSQRIK